MIVNGWRLFQYKSFKSAFDELEADVSALAVRDPKGYKNHLTTRLLALLYRSITQRVPTNPDATEFKLGNTLGSGNTSWRRVKQGMPDRYRLFFRFASTPIKVIVYVWFDDEDSLRKTGSKTEVYETFKRMLARGRVASSIDDLLNESTLVQ